MLIPVFATTTVSPVKAECVYNGMSALCFPGTAPITGYWCGSWMVYVECGGGSAGIHER
ncbi:MAG TPA: hypothetical protein VEP90_00010 [Methylomirabilota bacterium]|nr:hypothetical protein [Methylomirabilota bacterium]